MSDVIHHARYTPTQQAAIADRSRFRADIEAAARKVIPIVCLDKPQAVQISSGAFGPRILSAEETAFGPIVHREPVEPTPPNIKLIIRTVSRFYKVTTTEMLSQRRSAYLVRPRHVAMHLAKTLTLKSLPEIGRRMGDRDHTTVLHAVRKIERLLELDERLADEIEVLKLHIRQAVLNQ